MPFAKEQLGSLTIRVSREHKFGTDAFLLSDFARVRRKDRAVDLCAGCGIVGLLWFRDENGPRSVHSVELQQKGYDQMLTTVIDNDLAQRFFPIHGDLRQMDGVLPKGEMDLVTCNPPYKASGKGILSSGSADQLARHETECSLEDVCAAAEKLLKFGGRFCLCQRPERLSDICCAMRGADLEVKRIRFVCQRPTTAPWLVLVEGKKGSKPFLQVEPPLVIEREDGSFSEELLSIYQKGRKE